MSLLFTKHMEMVTILPTEHKIKFTRTWCLLNRIKRCHKVHTWTCTPGIHYHYLLLCLLPNCVCHYFIDLTVHYVYLPQYHHKHASTGNIKAIKSLSHRLLSAQLWNHCHRCRHQLYCNI
jgi:hypothetical protein